MDEFEEEEILFYMDFNCKFDNSLLDADKELKILGLDSDEPFLQLGTMVFKGEWKDTMGTYTFFEEDLASHKAEALMSVVPSKALKYLCKTNKMLHMSRIFVNLKTKKQAESALSGSDVPVLLDKVQPESTNSKD